MIDRGYFMLYFLIFLKDYNAEEIRFLIKIEDFLIHILLTFFEIKCLMKC